MATMIGTIIWRCLNHGSMEPTRSQMKSLLVKHVRVTIKKTEIKFQIFYSTIYESFNNHSSCNSALFWTKGTGLD